MCLVIQNVRCGADESGEPKSMYWKQKREVKKKNEIKHLANWFFRCVAVVYLIFELWFHGFPFVDGCFILRFIEWEMIECRKKYYIKWIHAGPI